MDPKIIYHIKHLYVKKLVGDYRGDKYYIYDSFTRDLTTYKYKADMISHLIVKTR